MNEPRASGEKVAYDLRPSKQTERYILVELLHRLRDAGIRIDDYKYVGFGANYFYDFRLFHQLLGIRDLTSVEGSKSVAFQTRCDFNRPYDDLELYLGLSTNYLKSANSESNYLIWLDYDFGYGSICHDDLATILPKFDTGTIVIITIDFDRPDKKSTKILEELKEELPSDVIRSVTAGDLSPANWRKTIVQLIEKSISLSIYGRSSSGISFLRLFSFEYRDTAGMYTFGGMIVDRATRKRVVRVARKWPFYCRDRLRNVKHIPRLTMTRMERNYLDKLALSSASYTGEIGVSVADFQLYKEYYRYLPVYSEIL